MLSLKVGVTITMVLVAGALFYVGGGGAFWFCWRRTGGEVYAVRAREARNGQQQ